MSVAGIVVLIVLVLVVLAILALPFVRPLPDSQQRALDKQRERALAYYERVLTNVRDLDDDFATGKISENEYHMERDVWSERGVKILRLFDELDHQHPLLADEHADDSRIDDAIEAAVRAVRLTEEGIA